MTLARSLCIFVLLSVGCQDREPRAAGHQQHALLETLGRRLFFDARLSDDGSTSCASCHQPDHAFADSVSLSRGVSGIELPRNSPSVLYSGAYRSLNWANPTLNSLESTLLVPLFSENPPEQHIGPRESSIYATIFTDPDLAQWRQTLIGTEDRGATRRLIIDSLALFVRSLAPYQSAYDLYQAGQESALSETALAGLALFEGRAQCSTCHSGILFNGQTQDQQGGLTPNIFRRNGLSDREARPGEAPGLAEFTGQAEDWNVFRVPSLRNVAQSAPYLHDGSVADLPTLLDQYNQLRQLGLNETELTQLQAFLEALSDPPEWFADFSLERRTTVERQSN